MSTPGKRTVDVLQEAWLTATDEAQAAALDLMLEAAIGARLVRRDDVALAVRAGEKLLRELAHPGAVHLIDAAAHLAAMRKKAKQ